VQGESIISLYRLAACVANKSIVFCAEGNEIVLHGFGDHPHNSTPHLLAQLNFLTASPIFFTTESVRFAPRFWGSTINFWCGKMS